MRVTPEVHVPPGQIRSAMVHERLAAGQSPRTLTTGTGRPGPIENTLGAPVDGAATSTTTATTEGEAVAVDMPWREEADAAIAKVEEQHGGEPMSDAMRDRVYADFAGRAAGLGEHAEKGLPTWKAWANVDAALNGTSGTGETGETGDTVGTDDTVGTAATDTSSESGGATEGATETAGAPDTSTVDLAASVAEVVSEDSTVDVTGSILDAGADVLTADEDVDADAFAVDADDDADDVTPDTSDDDDVTEPGAAQQLADMFMSYLEDTSSGSTLIEM